MGDPTILLVKRAHKFISFFLDNGFNALLAETMTTHGGDSGDSGSDGVCVETYRA